MGKKKKYDFAEVEIIRLCASDIITTSPGNDTEEEPGLGGSGNDNNGWTSWA